MPKECVQANFAVRLTSSCKKRLSHRKNSSPRKIGELYPIFKLVKYSKKKKKIKGERF